MIRIIVENDINMPEVSRQCVGEFVQIKSFKFDLL